MITWFYPYQLTPKNTYTSSLSKEIKISIYREKAVENEPKIKSAVRQTISHTPIQVCVDIQGRRSNSNEVKLALTQHI